MKDFVKLIGIVTLVAVIRHGRRCDQALAGVFAKRKLLSIITAGMLLLCMAACGGDDGGGNNNNNNNNTGFNIGDTGPGGGIIFYKSETGFTVQMVNSAQNYTAHYLEVAPTNQGNFAWSSAGFTSTSIAAVQDDSSSVGTGRKNTDLILATDADAPAAKACKNYNGGGQNDWFLPSGYEQNMLYEQKSILGFSSGFFWTSSQSGYSMAWGWDFTTSNWPQNGNKGTAYVVRAIRAF